MIDISSIASSSSPRVAGATGATARGSLLNLLEMSLSPVIGVAVLWVLARLLDGGIHPEYFLLAVVVFAMTFPGPSRLTGTVRWLLLDVLLSWGTTFGLLLAAGWTTGYVRLFPDEVIAWWMGLVPAIDLAAWLGLRATAPTLVRLQGRPVRALVAGMNPQGLQLAHNLQDARFHNFELVGFVDDRSRERLPDDQRFPLLGRFESLGEVIRHQRIDHVYISLPMASQPRILKILDDLKDTTASIYFVPDLFVTDLIQSKPTVLCGVPVISVCDTPFQGISGLLKRGSDIVLASLLLVLLAPVLIAIAVLVKATSPGPVIFKQRRYGQSGEQIVVYKFRSMTVAEDGALVTQARRNDQRITPLGAVLRRTSLDELPQFINVLQGRMSIVGPRPHAVAHNELYRKLIKGYMVRHKVKPGITGWAQVNGYRGETDTLEKMEGRIALDLDYLRNWSLKLDLLIILKTIRLVFKDQQAY
ncbi:MAG: undecaprenyl-phosphate glucose phosphotransferase [Hydrogenophaga sp.]|uniref:undecaprenyl-phosphate glucose phosphotransferase n=1 Tax=Hydrogenophaga sp. TaxID=1904254 RepID=UPI00169C62B7|nr:undecaprenyl-phosphate glucose phosphotransferase [Hydrogenophaga sp.]NIM40965.1 undecaprenyl-phosphate glucose phosphotransferase [Hydrogenophaga sp.]NIN26323.1 undecaprenyl-phosphate glucose phosphotransferase [Hydrogenophaga sp.]NIN31198.1 undecaprenyl-phosphate glucose phosphotransferase [Hydrogenophaga sp.]NIN55237.1 undecaprenyl-phosphate glucose phosphotransferase [Hydrogenophaga sp.]NIO53621.1 undecaprenyl-phosphate glucose phosphotransferase [Hydrogenophaga sp.]